MARQQSRDTAPELALRRRLWAAGLRFRLHYRALASSRCTVDIAFVRARVAVMVDGCFWHSCPEHGRLPSANHEWWQAKLARTKARDAQTAADLTTVGWLVLRVWEHEDPVEAANNIESAVRRRLAA
jgi:DNA mismatch endonuclease (patch repair protein)